MKALLKQFKDKGLCLTDIEKPKIKENDVLVKIKKTAICGTDIHIYDWDAWAQKTIPVPMQVGHEFVGEIVELGSAVNNYKIGARVSGEGHVVCGICRNCRAGTRHLCINTKGIGVNIPGCFAEYLSIPASNVFLIPDSISDDEASIFDPLGNAVHSTLSFDLVGEDVLITGAGPIGIMSAVIAKHIGARKVVLSDINPYRLNLAKKLGVEHTVDVSKENLKAVEIKLNMKEGFDVGLEMSGSSSAFNTMVSSLKAGAKIALLGILHQDTKVNWSDIIFKGLFIKGIYGREMFETWYKMTAMLESGLNIKNIITHKFKVQDYKEAFEIMKSGQSGKIILDWQ